MAENNATSASPGGKPVACTSQNTNMHKLRAKGYEPKVKVPGPKTPA